MEKKNFTDRILDRIGNTVREHNMIVPGDSVVAGLSGGPDSVCLVHALCSLKDELGIDRIFAVHINHCLRGGESDGDEAYSEELSTRLGIGFRVFRYDVAGIAEQSGTGTEAAGRKLRYDAFEKVRKETGAQRIAVAHNFNDQAETVLMRIMRGTGIAGLSGIPYMRDDGVIIRPVLDLRREEIEEYCRLSGLKPHIDSTNGEMIYTRNKIRLGLLPEIKREFNPNVEAALVRLGRQAAEDNDFIMSAAEKYIDRNFDEEKKCLKISGLAKLHASVEKRVIMACAEKSGIEYNVSAVHIERIMELVASGHEAREVDISMGYYARLSYGKLWFAKRSNGSAAVELPLAELEKNGRATVNAGDTAISMEIISGSERIADIKKQKKEKNSKVKAVLDFDRLIAAGNAVFRNRMPGDRITPIGMRGSKKLQDYFTDRKIPRHMRDDMILVVSGGKVLLAGAEVAAECCVSGDTGRILSIEY